MENGIIEDTIFIDIKNNDFAIIDNWIIDRIINI